MAFFSIVGGFVLFWAFVVVFEYVITKNTKVTEQLGFGKMVTLCEIIFRATKQK